MYGKVDTFLQTPSSRYILRIRTQDSILHAIERRDVKAVEEGMKDGPKNRQEGREQGHGI